MTSPNGTAGVGKWIVEKLSHGSREACAHYIQSEWWGDVFYTLSHNGTICSMQASQLSFQSTNTRLQTCHLYKPRRDSYLSLFPHTSSSLHCSSSQETQEKNIWKESVFTWCCAERNKAEVQLWRRRAHRFARIRYKIKNRINWATNLDWCLVGGEVEEDGLLA